MAFSLSRITKIRCPKCGYTIESWHRKYFAVGDPNITCPKCKTGLILKNLTEWEDQPKSEKILFMSVFYLQTVWYSILASLLFAILIEILFKIKVFLTSENQPTVLLPVFAVLVSIVVTIIRKRNITRGIEESKRRTEAKSLRISSK